MTRNSTYCAAARGELRSNRYRPTLNALELRLAAGLATGYEASLSWYNFSSISAKDFAVNSHVDSTLDYDRDDNAGRKDGTKFPYGAGVTQIDMHFQSLQHKSGSSQPIRTLYIENGETAKARSLDVDYPVFHHVGFSSIFDLSRRDLLNGTDGFCVSNGPLNSSLYSTCSDHSFLSTPHGKHEIAMTLSVRPLSQLNSIEHVEMSPSIGQNTRGQSSQFSSEQSDPVLSAEIEENGGPCTPPQAISGQGINASDDLWFFGNENTECYSESVTLTIQQPQVGTYIWWVSGNLAAVDFENNSDTYVGGDSVVLKSTGNSVAIDDVQIYAALVANSGNPLLILMTVPIPRSLVHLRNQDLALASRGFNTKIHYSLRDQFGRVLPRAIEMNEKWTSEVVVDFEGANWRRGLEKNAKVNPADAIDSLTGMPIAANPVPIPIAPQNPLGTTKIFHWNGAFFVGSRTSGRGIMVQTHTWQFFQDHGRHENVTGPPQS
jgi:hypothetical protein